MTSKSSKKNKEEINIFSKQELIEQWLELHPTLGDEDSIEANALAGYVLTPKGYMKTQYPIESDLVTR